MSLVDYDDNSWMSQVKILSRAIDHSDIWSAVIIFDQPVENFEIEAYKVRVAQIQKNMILLKSKKKERLDESKSFVLKITGSDEIIGGMVGFHAAELETLDCYDYENHEIYTTLKATEITRPVTTSEPLRIGQK